MKQFFSSKYILRSAAALLLSLTFNNTTFAQPTATVTVGNVTSTTNNYQVPMNTYYGYSYTQQLYLASEINKPLGGTVTMIRFYWSGGTSGLSNSNAWTVYIGNTTKTSFANSTDWVAPGTLSTIYTGTIVAPSTNQWIDIPLSTPFTYNGTGSIVVAVWENVGGYATSSSTFRTTATTNTRAISNFDDTNPSSATAPGSANGVYSYYPNIQFEFVVPPDNAGVNAITEPASTLPFCSGKKEVKVNVHNYGSNILNNVIVNWSVDNVLQTPVNYTTPIDMENTVAGPDAVVSVGSVNFPYNTPVSIKAWTSMPNGLPDTGPVNDSASGSITASLLGINDFHIDPQDTVICSGASVLLDAGEHPKDPIYIWSNGMLTRKNLISTQGPVSVKVQNTDGCFANDTVNVSVHPDPVANSIAIIDNGDCSFTFNVIGAQNADTYTWDFGDNTGASGDGSKTHSYVGNGTYTATLTLSNQCGEITITRVIECMNGATGVNSLSGLNAALKMYPNPGKDKVTISHKGNIKMTGIEIYNVIGQKVYSVKANGETQDINISDLASGIYNVIINTDQGKVTKKLEVIK